MVGMMFDHASSILIKTKTGNTVDLTYDSASSKIRIEAKIKEGNYMGIGFGTNMRDTDMVIF